MSDEKPVDVASETIERGPAPTEWPELPEDGMLDRILKIVVEEGKVDAAMVSPDATLESLGLVSVDVVSILMGIEEEFDAYVPMTEDLSTARNMSELISVLVNQMRPDDLKDVVSKST